MRYIKLLVFAVFFFLAMVFFFQNQGPLSQEMTLSLNLFFIPPMTSIPLPFYFIVIAAFFIGCLISMCFLWWDKMNASARYVRSKWRISALEKQVSQLTNRLDAEKKAHEAAPAQSPAATAPAFFQRRESPKAVAENAPAEEARDRGEQKS